ncbi:hypothetical protein VNI00_000705 [Paramarasmius palmivorus]|uniref:Uncharacterized protein n=1 Tax=Paramarasmius palmivorus TaxID=297713 RepID=A0AAW0E759_9AGAR
MPERFSWYRPGRGVEIEHCSDGEKEEHRASEWEVTDDEGDSDSDSHISHCNCGSDSELEQQQEKAKDDERPDDNAESNNTSSVEMGHKPEGDSEGQKSDERLATEGQPA